MENPINSIRSITPDNKASAIEGGNFAKELWFNAYYKGNSLIPQTEEGMRFCLAISIVNEDLNMDWQRFMYCTLSAKQIDFLGKAMSDQHHAKGIQISVAQRAEVFPKRPRIIPRKGSKIYGLLPKVLH